ncbi:MAG TPA: peptidylprolyl isomerase [Rhodothermales bacterium]|nr:peptidylprolyl isomerase [Rhodothermales bacterium]
MKQHFIITFFLLLCIGIFGLSVQAQNRPKPKTSTKTVQKPKPKGAASKPNAARAKPQTPTKPMPNPDDEGVFAIINTSKGEIVARLFYDKTPMTVANFIGLAEGTKNSSRGLGTPFFDGIKWHRVIANFMIQGGDPNSLDADPGNDGMGGPGYSFPDEFDPALKHDKPGVLSMANSGPATNGSQFFITHKDTPWLDGKHTVFGQVVTGQSVVDAIKQGDSILTIRIDRRGEKAKGFVVTQAFFDEQVQKAMVVEEQRRAEAALQAETSIKTQWPNAVKLASGLWVHTQTEGTGPQIVPQADVTFHFSGSILNGQKMDDSRTRGNPTTFKFGQNPILEGIRLAFLTMREGDRKTFVIPSKLAYAIDPTQIVIPGGAYIVYDLEILKVVPPQN